MNVIVQIELVYKVVEVGGLTGLYRVQSDPRKMQTSLAGASRSVVKVGLSHSVPVTVNSYCEILGAGLWVISSLGQHGATVLLSPTL